jgi:hypothetical protein
LQIDRKKFVFNVISGEERGSSGLLGCLERAEEEKKSHERWLVVEVASGGMGEDEKRLHCCVYMYISRFCRNLNLSSFCALVLSLASFPYVLC